MKVEEIRVLKPEELAKQLEAAHQELFDLRFRLTTKQLVNHRQLRLTRKKIAIIQTIIREKELA
ncbi:MAG: 50S ribosomal protein L29 [Chloroflexi bacterium]|nr:50S ribosomal protein L29 [Chloroflexota bacterium]